MVDHKAPLYLDYNATAPLCEAAQEAVKHHLSKTGNPSSTHAHGRQSRQILEGARQTLSTHLKTGRFDHIIFNSGGTEGNNTVLESFQTQDMKDLNTLILTSEIEHLCVLKAAPHAQTLPVTTNGLIDLETLNEQLKTHRTRYPDAPILVSCMLVNNETGVIQPLSEIIQIARTYGAYIHSDVVQGLGRIPFDLDLFPLDYATISSHKMGGLSGFGALYCRAKAPFTALINGGGQEHSKRSGTLNTMGAAAFGAALLQLDYRQWSPIASLRDTLEKDILSFCPQARIWGETTQRVANTSSLMMPGVDAMTQMMAFDLAGISVSAGSACSSGTVKPSHVLKAMGISDKDALTTIRVSLTPHTTQADCDRFVETWKTIYNRCHHEATQNDSDHLDQKG